MCVARGEASDTVSACMGHKESVSLAVITFQLAGEEGLTLKDRPEGREQVTRTMCTHPQDPSVGGGAGIDHMISGNSDSCVIHLLPSLQQCLPAGLSEPLTQSAHLVTKPAAHAETLEQGTCLKHHLHIPHISISLTSPHPTLHTSPHPSQLHIPHPLHISTPCTHSLRPHLTMLKLST